MMLLRTSPTSPFGRKVKIAAAVLGLSDRIEVVGADTSDAADPLRKDNPLGKVPVLVDGGKAIYDSRVIVAYLDSLAGGGKIVPAGPRKIDALVLEALADGITDASILRLYEVRHRPEEKRHPTWVDYQAAKVERGLATLEAAPPPAAGPVPDVGQIALACALGFQDLRFEGTWRARHPRLVAWLDAFARAVPSFEATRFKG
jgi:glutathione S-transferase